MKSEEKFAPAQASRLMLSSNEFSAVLAHEIASPLNGMFTNVQLLERHLYGKKDCIDDTVADLLRSVTDEIARLTLLLQELRSQHTFSPLDLHPTSLASEVRDLLGLQGVQYAQLGIRIEQDIPSDLPLVMADRGKLKQILLNLCNNAVDAMPTGGTLSVKCYQAGAQICVDITDTGEGVPEGTQLFKPFATSKPGGTGLGLAIVQELVRQHNGTISYASQPGKGTVFCIHLPLGGSVE